MRQKVESLFNGITVNDAKPAKLRSRPWLDQRYVTFFTPRSGSSWLGVSGRDKTGTSAAQKQASGGVPILQCVIRWRPGPFILSCQEIQKKRMKAYDSELSGLWPMMPVGRPR